MQTSTSNQSRIRTFASAALIACAIATSSLIGFGGNAAAQDPTLQVTQRHRSAPLTFTAQPARSSRDSYLHWRTGFVAP